MAAVIGLIGMFLTLSRSSFLGISLTAPVLLSSIRRVATLGIVLVMVGLVYFGGHILNIHKAKEAQRITDFSVTRQTNKGRIQQYTYALNVFSKHPIVGEPKGESAKKTLIHSVLLRILVDYGLFGGISYLLVIFGVIISLFRQRDKSGTPNRILAVAALCSFMLAIIDAWTHSSGFLVRDVNQAGMIGLFLGLLMHGRRKASGEPARGLES